MKTQSSDLSSFRFHADSQVFSLPFYSLNNPSPSDVISTELPQGGDVPSRPPLLMYLCTTGWRMPAWTSGKQLTCNKQWPNKEGIILLLTNSSPIMLPGCVPPPPLNGHKVGAASECFVPPNLQHPVEGSHEQGKAGNHGQEVQHSPTTHGISVN